MSLSVEKCLQAWTNSLKQMDAKADIVFLGDSLVYYGSFSSVFSNKVVCNLGLRGDTLRGMIERIEQVKLLSPKVVYLMAGINDVSLMSEEEFGFLYGRLADSIVQELPGVILVCQSIIPVNNQEFTVSCDGDMIRRCNSQIERVAIKRGYKYLDLYSLYEENGLLPRSLTTDGIHLIPNAYDKWYNALSNTI